MHEWALAEAIISAVSEVAEKENLKEVKEVSIRVGELQQVDKKILKLALLQIRSGKLADTKFVMKTERARFKCKACGHQWFFKEVKVDSEVKESIHFVPEVAHAYIRCPECSSPDFEIIAGRGVWVTGIRGVK